MLFGQRYSGVTPLSCRREGRGGHYVASLGFSGRVSISVARACSLVGDSLSSCAAAGRPASSWHAEVVASGNKKGDTRLAVNPFDLLPRQKPDGDSALLSVSDVRARSPGHSFGEIFSCFSPQGAHWSVTWLQLCIFSCVDVAKTTRLTLNVA